MRAVAAATEADALVHDHGAPPPLGGIGCVVPFGRMAPLEHGRGVQRRTEWVLLTSGTTGPPKAVLHTLSSLTAAFGAGASVGAAAAEARVWSTFYDIRRYGGLQILLRALLGGNSMVLAHPDEAVDDFLRRAGECGVTHISGTPSHWRRALMSGRAGGFMPRYVRLSGEIADQGILDRLRAAFPAADIAHAFASTEAGVAFSVTDGRAGFPADLLERPAADVGLKIVDGSLRVRSAGVAQRYLGDGGREIPDADGFVDTRDLIERQGDRCLLRRPAGRDHQCRRHEGESGGSRSGDQPTSAGTPVAGTGAAQCRARRGGGGGCRACGRQARDAVEAVRSEILEACRRALAPHKVPVRLRFVPSLEVGHTGKLARPAPDRAQRHRLSAHGTSRMSTVLPAERAIRGAGSGARRDGRCWSPAAAAG